MRPALIEAVKLLQSNDPELVSDAIGLLQRTVYAFSMKVCGHPEDAEDTMQDVLILSVPHLTRITNPKALAVWLYTVTRNRCWRARRKSIHAPKHTLSLEELMPDEAELSLLLRQSGRDPERQILRREENLLLHEAILGLPTQYRIVLVLHDMEDLDTEQIAQILGLKSGTVRVRLHRARLYVRKAMRPITERTVITQPVPSRRHKVSSKKAAFPSRPRQCKEVFTNLSEYLDDRLTPRDSEEMRLHIEGCPACIAFISDLRQAIDRCQALDVGCDPQIAPKLRSVLTKEYLRMLDLSVRKKSSSLL
jgi:RNA polymerase sigma-70 factor (ECF subfamily)